MKSPLQTQIETLDNILARRLLTAKEAEAVAGAKASLQFLQANEEFIREAIAERRRARELPMVKAALKEFPDAEVMLVKKVENDPCQE